MSRRYSGLLQTFVFDVYLNSSRGGIQNMNLKDMYPKNHGISKPAVWRLTLRKNGVIHPSFLESLMILRDLWKRDKMTHGHGWQLETSSFCQTLRGLSLECDVLVDRDRKKRGQPQQPTNKQQPITAILQHPIIHPNHETEDLKPENVMLDAQGTDVVRRR